jgi:tRNA (cytidine/uridine-2'-O-)-methyltransferase
MTTLLPPELKLRCVCPPRPFHIVLVEPEIPPNTGNIARLCAATGCALHLIGPLGFRIDEHAVRRAGLDYWPLVELHVHSSLRDAEQTIAAQCRADHNRDSISWLFSGRAPRSVFDQRLEVGDALVFGKESVGLDEELLASRVENVLGIPTAGPVRSLNLANSVAIVAYEALRQNELTRVI